MNVSAELAYLTLTVTCISSIYLTSKNDIFFIAGAALLLAQAFLGVVKSADLVSNHDIKRHLGNIQGYLSQLIPLLVLPAFDTSLWLRYNFSGDKFIPFIHIVVGIVMAIVYIVETLPSRFVDALIGIESFAIIGAAIVKSNLFAIGSTLLFLSGYGLQYHYTDDDKLPISKESLYQYLLSGCVFFCTLAGARGPGCPLFNPKRT